MTGRIAVANAVLLSLVLVACGGSSGAPAPTSTTTPATTAAGITGSTLNRLGLTRNPSPGVLHGCRRVAARTKLDFVYCPPITPTGRAQPFESGSYGNDEPRTYVINFQSPSLPQPSSNGGHWLVQAAKPPQLVATAFTSTMSAKVTGHFREAGVRATTLLKGGGEALEANHAIVRWQVRGVGYDLSVHGHPNAAQAEAMARALILEMVRCPGTTGSQQGCQLALPAGAR
jgi:hypothetical protein